MIMMVIPQTSWLDFLLLKLGGSTLFLSLMTSQHFMQMIEEKQSGFMPQKLQWQKQKVKDSLSWHLNSVFHNGVHYVMEMSI